MSETRDDPQTATPGPWEAVNQQTHLGRENESLAMWRIVNQDGKTITQISYSEKENRVANARLIAAAPDLLEACKAAAQILAMQGLALYVDKHGTPAAIRGMDLDDVLHAAIKKAEGKDG